MFQIIKRFKDLIKNLGGVGGDFWEEGGSLKYVK